MIDNRTVGKTIAGLRQAKGMTQQQLAAAMNVSHQAVSKWENGAALPDIQTMVELTQLFGITVEQLISGDVPEARMESAQTPPAPAQSAVGSFVNGVINDIGNLFKSEPRNAPAPEEEEDGAQEAEVKTEKENPEKPENIDLQNLLQMAPFMSKQALEEMLSGQKLSAADIARFAPFVSGECLEKLIADSESEMNWDTLRRVAPFLKKEAVDALARMVAAGEKWSKSSGMEDVGRKIDEVSQKIGKGVDKAVRKVVKIGGDVAGEVGRAFEGLTTSETVSRAERQARLRRSAFERAMEDGKWDWIAAHIDEITEEDLKKRISEKANSLGMQDWVCEHLGGYADAEAIDSAIANGDWGWLGEHVWKFDDELQQKVALAAMKAENWQWLAAYAEQIALENCVVEIAGAARRAGARMLAVQLTKYDMQPAQVEQTALVALSAGAFEFFDLIGDALAPDALCKCCIRLANSGDWDNVKRYAERLDGRGVEWLMEIAIDAGNFDAIDMLDALMKKDETEGDDK